MLQDNLPTQENVSWFDIQAVGPEALRWRMAMIDTATTSIDAQYFIWKEDAVGSLMLDRLLQAADRGVRVRMLIDDSFLAGEDQLALAADAHPNLELRIFNPFKKRSNSMLVRYVENLNDYKRTNHRMHNKYATGPRRHYSTRSSASTGPSFRPSWPARINIFQPTSHKNSRRI